MEELIVIAVCLFLNALFASYEMAFVSAPKPELRKLSRTGNKDAQRALVLRENPERTLSVIQIGITLGGAISAAVGGAGASESIEPLFRETYGLSESTAEFLSIIAVVIPLTYLSVVIGELVPKSIALRHSIKITLLGVRWLAIADRILSPIVTALEWSTKQILRTFFRSSKPSTPTTETTVEIDALPQHHQQAILNLTHIERKRIKDILLPWKEVNYIKTSDSMDTMVPLIFASGHTRLPVADENGNVMGVLHTKEALASREAGNKEWRTLIRPILSVSPEDAILSALRLMQKNRSHMAVVVQGVTPQGIVTFEDISEEIWGDLYDEDEDSQLRKVFADRVTGKLRPPIL